MSEQNETVEVRKSGGTRALEITLSRNTSLQFPGAHYLVDVRAHQVVENFFRNLGSGKKGPVHLYGNQWQAPIAPESIDLRNPNGTPRYPLEVYEMARDFDQSRFLVNSPGLPLKYDGSLNLSFLRLAGISEGRGVRFGVKEPISKEGLNRLRGEIRDVIGDFYADYLEPYSASVTVIVED